MLFPAGLRTRFAPSPTGSLHLGGAFTALASWVLARSHQGQLILRVEDLDPPRVVPGSTESILTDLEWLGLDWDEGPRRALPDTPYMQSERTPHYEAALAKLETLRLVYACDCSRSEIARVASAPHAGEDIVYPGVCRDKPADREMKRPPCMRLRVPNEVITFEDLVVGPVEQNLAESVGDFVLRRGDGVFAYQLAVVVDDLAMRVSHVLRGADLLASTPRQLLLAKVLGGMAPRYGHLPLVLGADGARLEKRTRGAQIPALRAAGITAETIIGELAFALGFASDKRPRRADELLDQSRHRSFPHESLRVPASFMT